MTFTRIRRLSLLGTLALTACVTAEKRVDQGIRLEQSGRPAEAARRYADALRRDPSMTTARERLQQTGDQAVAELIGAAGTLPLDEAADQFVEVDDLVRVADAVGVTLRVPEDYDALRRAAFDRALDVTLVEARDAAARGDYSTAASRLTRAGDRWEATDLQRAALDRARFETYVAWAGTALRSEEYRSAYQRAQQAIDALGPGSNEAPRAMDIQAEALRRGTIRVAVMPVAPLSELRGRLPGELLAELEDDLMLNRWRNERLFIAIADPQEVARAARRLGYVRQVPTRNDARAVAGAVRADLAVILLIDSLEVGETDVQQNRVAARTQAGADTAYTVRSGRHRVRVRLSYTLVDASGYQQAERGSVWADAAVRFRRATYAGNPTQLVLDREARELFSAAGPRLSDDQVRSLAADLGSAVERELLSDLDRRIR